MSDSDIDYPEYKKVKLNLCEAQYVLRNDGCKENRRLKYANQVNHVYSG